MSTDDVPACTCPAGFIVSAYQTGCPCEGRRSPERALARLALKTDLDELDAIIGDADWRVEGDEMGSRRAAFHRLAGRVSEPWEPGPHAFAINGVPAWLDFEAERMVVRMKGGPFGYRVKADMPYQIVWGWNLHDEGLEFLLLTNKAFSFSTREPDHGQLPLDLLGFLGELERRIGDLLWDAIETVAARRAEG